MQARNLFFSYFKADVVIFDNSLADSVVFNMYR